MKTRLLVSSFITTLVFTAILLFAAGTLNYFEAWLYLGIGIITTFMTYFSTRNNEDLMKERSKIGEGSKCWDKLILGISTIVFIIFLVVAGLDSGRYGWTPKMHWSINVAGIVLIIAGQALFLKAKKENTFFSSVVRIQTDRGHTVCDTGVYRIVRHPGYLGMIISNLGLPLITDSLWSTIPILSGIILLLIRTYLEDETLKKELDGYVEYTKRTKKRIIPGIW